MSNTLRGECKTNHSLLYYSCVVYFLDTCSMQVYKCIHFTIVLSKGHLYQTRFRSDFWKYNKHIAWISIQMFIVPNRNWNRTKLQTNNKSGSRWLPFWVWSHFHLEMTVEMTFCVDWKQFSQSVIPVIWWPDNSKTYPL